MALLDIKNLTVKIKTEQGLIKIIDNVSLTINDGEIYGLVGESGSGKSLIAKIICNVFKDSWIITADRFRFHDIELLKLSPNKRRKIVGNEISMIYQQALSYLDPSQKIARQIINNIPNRTFKGRFWQWFGWKKRRAIELLHRVGIKDHKKIMNSYPCDISENDAQKVMIAIAIACQPKLLIADEPTNTLEPSIQQQIFRLLMSMNQNQNMGILLASNDMGYLAQVCQRMTILYCGQYAESGYKDAIFSHPHHPYTAALIHTITDFNHALPFKSKLNILQGNVPLLDKLPEGCRFAPRCPFAQKPCIEKPQPRKLKQQEFACHFPLNLR